MKFQALPTEGTAPLHKKANCIPKHNWNLVRNKLTGKVNSTGQVKYFPFLRLGLCCHEMPQLFPWRCTGLGLTGQDDQRLNHHPATPGFSWWTGHPIAVEPKWSSSKLSSDHTADPGTFEISMWQLANEPSNFNSLKKQVVYHVALPRRFPHTMG